MTRTAPYNGQIPPTITTVAVYCIIAVGLTRLSAEQMTYLHDYLTLLSMLAPIAVWRSKPDR